MGRGLGEVVLGSFEYSKFGIMGIITSICFLVLQCLVHTVVRDVFVSMPQSSLVIEWLANFQTFPAELESLRLNVQVQFNT
jgi:hypothetical protein